MNILVLAGGVSTERDVSFATGKNVYNALKNNGHKAIIIDPFMGYEGDTEGLFDADIDWSGKIEAVKEGNPDIEAVKKMRDPKYVGFFGPNVIKLCREADVVFMALHGENGENGKIQAVFDLVHLGLPFRRHIRLPRRAAQEHVHPCTVADLNPHGTWHAIPAAAAEAAGEFFPLSGDKGLQFLVHRGIFLRHGQPLIQLTQFLNAPDGDDIVILAHEGLAGPDIGQHAAGQPLHGNIADIGRLRAGGQGQIALG